MQLEPLFPLSWLRSIPRIRPSTRRSGHVSISAISWIGRIQVTQRAFTLSGGWCEIDARGNAAVLSRTRGFFFPYVFTFRLARKRRRSRLLPNVDAPHTRTILRSKSPGPNARDAYGHLAPPPTVRSLHTLGSEYRETARSTNRAVWDGTPYSLASVVLHGKKIGIIRNSTAESSKIVIYDGECSTRRLAITRSRYVGWTTELVFALERCSLVLPLPGIAHSIYSVH